MVCDILVTTEPSTTVDFEGLFTGSNALFWLEACSHIDIAVNIANGIRTSNIGFIHSGFIGLTNNQHGDFVSFVVFPKGQSFWLSHVADFSSKAFGELPRFQVHAEDSLLEIFLAVASFPKEFLDHDKDFICGITTTGHATDRPNLVRRFQFKIFRRGINGVSLQAPHPGGRGFLDHQEAVFGHVTSLEKSNSFKAQITASSFESSAFQTIKNLGRIGNSSIFVKGQGNNTGRIFIGNDKIATSHGRNTLQIQSILGHIPLLDERVGKFNFVDHASAIVHGKQCLGRGVVGNAGKIRFGSCHIISLGGNSPKATERRDHKSFDADLSSLGSGSHWEEERRKQEKGAGEQHGWLVCF